MAAYTLRVRRFDPESGRAPYWEEHDVALPPHHSVLDALLQVKDDADGSLAVRCSCRAGICGSCGVRVGGRAALACNTHLRDAAARAADGRVTVEPMGNMPVVKDLVVDMDEVHWRKLRSVMPWLVNAQPVPDREYVVPHEQMLDVTQTMACIQCGACVSDCLSLEADPLFVGPAAAAKAYRFVGDPRDAAHEQRLRRLAEDPHGVYDCTHCFSCVEVCPKGVAPMDQIIRLRRIAASDHQIVDRNNGERHEHAFTTLVHGHGLLHEAELLPRSYGGDSWLAKLHPRAGLELAASLPTIACALLRRKVTARTALVGERLAKDDRDAVDRIFARVEGRAERSELSLYAGGLDDDPPAESEAR